MIHIRGDSAHVRPQKREGSIIGEEDETQHLQGTDASFSDLRMITDATLDDTEVMRKQVRKQKKKGNQMQSCLTP
jgi:hypothetical protein